MNKRILLILFLGILVFGCASNKSPLSRNEILVLKEKIDFAITNCQSRSKSDLQHYQTLIKDSGLNNISSDELLEVLNKRGYIETDISKNFGEDVAKIYLENVFHENYTILSTKYIKTTIGGINFRLEYLSNHKQIPNIISFVYVNGEDDKLRVFYKINYEFGYYSKGELTDGNEILKFY